MEQPKGSALLSHPDGRPEPSARTTVENGPPVSPPYWQQEGARANSNLTDVPSSSQPSISNKNRLSGGPIRLHDNSTEESSDTARACWAKAVRIDDYVIVSGSVSKAGLGSYVVWNCTVETLNVGTSFPSVRALCDLPSHVHCHLHVQVPGQNTQDCGANICIISDRVARSRSANDIQSSTS
jgi:hypothetical protein